MRRLATLSAAMMVVVVLGWLIVIDRTADTTFAAVIEKVHQAKSATCWCKRTFAGTESVSKLYIREDAIRNEVPDHGVLIFDRIRKKAIVLDERSKVAVFPSLVPGAPIPNPLEELRNVKQESAERIGEDTLKGRQLTVYRLTGVDLLENTYGENDADIKLWVDPQTQLPVRLMIFVPRLQIDNYVEFSDFHWNEELDPSLFSLEIPEGYTVGKKPLAQPEPAEKMLGEGENVRTEVSPANSAESAENAKAVNHVFGHAFAVKDISDVRIDVEIRSESTKTLALYIADRNWASGPIGEGENTWATLEVSDQIRLEGGDLGHGMIFARRAVKQLLAITKDGQIPYGKVKIRETGAIVRTPDAIIVADIEATDGSRIPISLKLQ